MENQSVTNGQPSHWLRDKLQAAGAAERQVILVRFINDQLLEILEWDASERPKLDRGFLEVGLDSLMAVELQFRLQKALGYGAEASEEQREFEMTSAEDLAQFLLDHRLDLSAPSHADAAGA
ncbi:MAG: acyl carrier protein [Rhodobacter sp.]|nr:acyl carrier protein [Rhodobacter sp.]